MKISINSRKFSICPMPNLNLERVLRISIHGVLLYLLTLLISSQLFAGQLDRGRSALGPMYKQSAPPGGILIASLISDKNQDYRFWNEIEIIDIESENTFRINPDICFTSFCFYSGKVPSGRYFINKLYAHKKSGTVTITSSLEIRNRLGHFSIEKDVVTDLGLFGVYQAEDGYKKPTSIYVHDVNGDNLSILQSIYPKKIHEISSTVLGWSDKAWMEKTRMESYADRHRFSDFFKLYDFGDASLLFPTVLGHIYEYHVSGNYKLYSLNTNFSILALLKEKDRLLAGGEGGRLYVLDAGTGSWKTIQKFPYDESVVEIYKLNDKYTFFTVKESRIMAYNASSLEGELSRPKKVSLDLKDDLIPDIFLFKDHSDSLSNYYIDRNHLRDLMIKRIGSEVYVGDLGSTLKIYSLQSGKWSRKREMYRVVDIVENKDGYLVLRRRDLYWFLNARYFEKIFGNLDKMTEREIPLLTELYFSSYSSKFKLMEEEKFHCWVNSAMLPYRPDNVMFLCGRYEVSTERDRIEKKNPSIYGFDATSREFGDLGDIEGLGLYYYLRFYRKNEKILMIDRASPKIFESSGGFRMWEERMISEKNIVNVQ